MPPLEKKFVIYSGSRGTFLGLKDGKAVWSKDPGVTDKDTAPLFKGGDQATATIAEAGEVLPGDAQMREVWPASPDADRATAEDCTHVGLPRWGD